MKRKQQISINFSYCLSLTNALSRVACERLSFLQRAGKGNRFGGFRNGTRPTRTWSGQGLVQLHVHMRSLPLFFLPPLLLPSSLLPPPSLRAPVFVDCSHAVVIVTVMQTEQPPVCSDMSRVCVCVVHVLCVSECECVSDKTPSTRSSEERKCLESYVMSSLLEKKGKSQEKGSNLTMCVFSGW